MFMEPGSPWVQMEHRVGKFFAFTNKVPELEDKVLMFVGDRGETREPMVVQPPVLTTWKWLMAAVVMDVAQLQAFVQSDKGIGLWQPKVGEGTVGKVPYILSLPFVLMEFLASKGQCRSHELLEEVETFP
jgi:hypothetical protein